ncbi:MAG TPA: DUF3566 domain-containing protein [Patescibacteria group bacterium]|nr:DUF3566 domain-containing protein [Patescibacteria group bacterium]
MEHRFEIRHIPLWPAVKLVFVLFLIIGILFAILYAVILTGVGFLATTLGESAFGEDFGILKNLGFVMIPVIAVVYALFGSIAVVIWVVIYNLIASVIGGVEVDLKQKARSATGPAPRPIEIAGTSESPASDNNKEG